MYPINWSKGGARGGTRGKERILLSQIKNFSLTNEVIQKYISD